MAGLCGCLPRCSRCHGRSCHTAAHWPRLWRNGRIYLLIGIILVPPSLSCRKEPLTRTDHYRNCQSQSGFALKQHHPLLSRALSRCPCHVRMLAWELFSLLGSTGTRRARRADDGHARAPEGGAVEVCAETVRRDRTRETSPLLE